uniref:Uncharacterized protein n=1 Tax=Davidia involucrata TaxID=16924 RepID=A0A5B7B6A5_DAVIN
MDRRTLTMNWDGLGDDDDDDQFFESYDRISSAVPLDLLSSGSDDDYEEEFDDSRISFASAISSAASIDEFRGFEAFKAPSSMLEDYDVWMAEPGSINDRRKRLLQGMGLSSNKDLLSFTSNKFKHAVSKKVGNGQVPKLTVGNDHSSPSEESKQEPSPSPSPSMPIVLVRSRSDGDIESFSVNTKQRKEELIGPISKQRLTRTSSTLLTPHTGVIQYARSPNRARNKSSGRALSSILSNRPCSAFFLIKNLDTGKEFIVNEYNEDGMWNRLSDLQTGKQLTMEEFEKSVGYSPVVKELMRRENVSRNLGYGRKVSTNSYLSKSFRNSKRRGVALLKNIKGVANSMSGLIVDKEREHQSPIVDQQRSNKNNSSSQWVKAHQHGKSYKDFTVLHLCQEIQAHVGTIWSIRFSLVERMLYI